MENQISAKKSHDLQTDYEFNRDEKTSIMQSLATCLTVQRTYGKSASDLESITRTFLMVLDEYKAIDIMDALKYWLTHEREFPTPADINEMLSDEIIYKREIYNRIVSTQRSGQSLRRWEHDYIAGYEGRDREQDMRVMICD